MSHVKGEESSYNALHVGQSPGARIKEEAFKYAAGLANPDAADPNVAHGDEPQLAGDAPEPTDLTQGVATVEVKLYETAPAGAVPEEEEGSKTYEQPVKDEKSYFTPDVARRAVAYSAKDGVMEKPGSLGARNQELITRTSGELLRLGNDAARDGRYLTPDAPPVPGGRGQSHEHMPPSPPPMPVKTGAYVSSKPASDALDILDGVNLAGEEQSADGGGGGDNAGAYAPHNLPSLPCADSYPQPRRSPLSTGRRHSTHFIPGVCVPTRVRCYVGGEGRCGCGGGGAERGG